YGQTSYYQPEGYRGVTHILLQVDDELLQAYQDLSAQLEEQQEADEEAAAEETAEPAGEEAAAEETAEPAGEEAAAEETAEPAGEEAAPEETAEPVQRVTREDVDAAYAAIIASVQPTIDEINAKLAEGVAFADLVAEYGTDPGMQSEPYKTEGYAVHLDSILWDPVFVQAAFSVENVGDIAQPVVGSYGVHIVQYTRDVPAGPVELTDEIKAELREDLLATAENEMFNTTMDAWLAAAEVTYTDEGKAFLPQDSDAE
ncbi:MAG: peptidylprolyl isomerase, partial [Aristaeellaceae bacterium]